MYVHMHLMSLNGQMEFEFDICTCTYILTYIQTCYYIYSYYYIAVGQVTGVRLTCEPVGLINRCTIKWEVSNTLLYVRMYYMHKPA